MKQRLGILLVCLLCHVFSVSAAAAEIVADEWAYPYMQGAEEAGFLPNTLLQKGKQGISRESFAEISVLFYETVSGKEAPNVTQSVFQDCQSAAVLAAHELDIVNGVAEGAFAPDTILTREQMAIMISRTLDACGVALESKGAKQPFSDISDLSEGVRDCIQTLYEAQVVSGYGDNRFYPARKLTVQEAITAFYLAYSALEGVGAAETPASGEEAVQPEEPATSEEAEIPAAEAEPYEIIAISGKEVALGESSAELKARWGEPTYIDESVYGLERYVYVNDWENFFFVTLSQDKVCEIFTCSPYFSY